jgi:MFS family permease
MMVGLAAGAFFAPMIAAATDWFTDNRSLAVSLVSAGMGVAPMTIFPLARWLISTYDWRTAMMVTGMMARVLLIGGSLCATCLGREGGSIPGARSGVGRARDNRDGGVPVTAIHRPRFDRLPLLCRAFRPDLPYGELCDRVRDCALRRGFEL